MKKLIKLAIESRMKAYAPYSKYKVGAAILCKSGKLYGGCNIENVNYTQTRHAEENAINNAIMDGELKESGRKFIKALVVCHEGDSMPCGSCRQTIQEFCDDCPIYCVNPGGEIIEESTLKEILPLAFTPTHLGIK